MMANTIYNRQIVLDTETTGMNFNGPHYEGHRIIEIGAVEVINRRLTGNHFHVYIKPDRLVDPDAFAVHGISDEFLADKPKFSDIASEFISFVDGAELIIHNAPFDVGFINHEFNLYDPSLPKIETFCGITDTLQMARKLFPGKKNNLDALCDRYDIDNSHRTLHGALLDSEILADVYLLMTGGQTSLSFFSDNTDAKSNNEKSSVKRVAREGQSFNIIYADTRANEEHEKMLDLIDKKSQGALWRLN